MDPLVKITKVQNVVGFDPTTLLPSRQVQVTYTVGTHGPFTLVTPMHDFTQDYVERETQKVVDVLRATGALPAG